MAFGASLNSFKSKFVSLLIIILYSLELLIIDANFRFGRLRHALVKSTVVFTQDSYVAHNLNNK